MECVSKINLFGIQMIKEIGHEEPYYSTKILIFSFIWAGLAALHTAIQAQYK